MPPEQDRKCQPENAPADAEMIERHRHSDQQHEPLDPEAEQPGRLDLHVDRAMRTDRANEPRRDPHRPRGSSTPPASAGRAGTPTWPTATGSWRSVPSGSREGRGSGSSNRRARERLRKAGRGRPADERRQSTLLHAAIEVEPAQCSQEQDAGEGAITNAPSMSISETSRPGRKFAM